MSDFFSNNPLYIGALLLALAVPVYLFSSSRSAYLAKDAPLSASELEELSLARKAKKKKKIAPAKPVQAKRAVQQPVDDSDSLSDVEVNKRVESVNPFAVLEAQQQQSTQTPKKRNAKKKNRQEVASHESTPGTVHSEVLDKHVSTATDHGAYTELNDEGTLQVTEFKTTVTTTDATVKLTADKESKSAKKKKKKAAEKQEETVHVVERTIDEDVVVKGVHDDGQLVVTETHKETVLVDVTPEPAAEEMTPVVDKRKKKKGKKKEEDEPVQPVQQQQQQEARQAVEPAHAESVKTVVTTTVFDPQVQYELGQLKAELQMHRQQSLQAQMQMMQLEQANARLEEETRRLLREQGNVTEKREQDELRRLQLEKKIKSLEEREEQLKYTNRILFEQLSEAKEREKERSVGALGGGKNGISA